MTRLTIFILLIMISFTSINANDDIQLDLLFVGDIMGHRPQIESAYDKSTETYNYKPCFKYVKPIIESADLAIGNLEVTLSDKGRYTGYPLFRTPDALATALKDAGFDMLVTANNHSNDNGAYGVTHTINVLDKLKFFHTGTFKNQTEKDLYYPLIVYKKGFKLAFLNYTYGMNGMSTVEPTIVNEIDEPTIDKDIKAAQKLKPDAIIVIMHWGGEYQLNENKYQYALSKKIFASGANLVIGAHPHVIQPIKNIPYTDEDGKNKTGLTVFSMGNFISNQQYKNTDGGLIVEISLTKKKGSNKAKIANCNYIPVWRYHSRVNEENPMGTFYTLPISAFENEDATDLTLTKVAKSNMNSFVTRMRKHLAKHEGKERFVTLKQLKIKTKKTAKVGQKTTKNSYARFANFSNKADTSRPRMIMPINDDRYIIHETESTTTPISQPKPVTKPTLPAGSTDKTGNVRTPPVKPATKKPTTETKPISNNTANNTNPTDKYLVQIQTTSSLYAASLPFDNVVVKESGGYFRYYLPAGNNLADAKIALENVHSAGFEDAYVVFNKLNEAVKDDGNTTKNGDVKVYKIQFQSSTKMAVPQKLPVNEYEVLETDDGRFKYFVGKADSLTEAMTLLKTIQTAGYKDAFVVQFINGKPKE